MTAIHQLIEIIKQKRYESEISNTLLRFVQIEAEKLLETEKEKQDEFAIGFAKWCMDKHFSLRPYNMYDLLETYKKEKL